LFLRLLLLLNGKLASSAYYQYEPCIIIIDYTIGNGNIVKVLTEHTDSIYCFVNLSSELFASGSHDKTIKIWDTNNNYNCLRTLVGHLDWVSALLYVNKEDYLISGSDDKTIKVWDIRDNYYCIKTIQAHKHWVTSLTLLPNGYFASGSKDSNIKIWNLKGFKCINVLQGEPDIVTSLLLMEDKIISAYYHGWMMIWEY
jgi:platelet-activating factor acetylhydrolase IB subunit alpha